MTSPDEGPHCALCGRPAAVVIDPPHRTLAREADPSDHSSSITVILPRVPLCDDHGVDVRGGERTVGWCDDVHCRAYGEVGETSSCGDRFEELVSATRHRPAPKRPPNKKQKTERE